MSSTKNRSRASWYARIALALVVIPLWTGLILLSGASDALAEIDLRLQMVVLLVPQLAIVFALLPPLERFVEHRINRTPGEHQSGHPDKERA